MPTCTHQITDTRAAALPAPVAGYTLFWCPKTPGFGVRVTASGARSFVAERRVNGKTVRRTLGPATGRAAISTAAARSLQVEVSSELQQGKDRSAEARVERQRTSLTVDAAVRDYVASKRRSKDGLPLKERTKQDYVGMLAEPTDTRRAGALYHLADVPLHKLTAGQIRNVYEKAPGGARQRDYAMQVLRAVLSWNGIKVADNPLSAEAPGRDRIHIAQPVANPQPIPPERLPAWWAAASAMSGHPAADALRLILLTGMRPGEVSGLKVGDVDLAAGHINLTDTKNRQPHRVMLSTQALDLLRPHVEGGRPKALVFDMHAHGAALIAINTKAGVSVSPHKLRHTFASVADKLVTGFELRAMLNHITGGGATGFYVGKHDPELLVAWQRVADAITGASMQ